MRVKLVVLLRSYEGAIFEEISGVRKRSTLLRHLATPLASRQLSILQAMRPARNARMLQRLYPAVPLFFYALTPCTGDTLSPDVSLGTALILVDASRDELGAPCPKFSGL